MNPADEVARLLKEHSAVLKRKHKHFVWHIPGKGIFTQAKTSGDHMVAYAELKDLRHILGLVAVNDTSVSTKRKNEYRPKHQKQDAVAFKPTPFNSALADQLLMSGAAEAVLREEVESLKRQQSQLAEAYTELQGECQTWQEMYQQERSLPLKRVAQRKLKEQWETAKMTISLIIGTLFND